MSSTRKSALDYIEVLKRKAPEYLDLLTAETDDEFEAAFDAILEGNQKDQKNMDFAEAATFPEKVQAAMKKTQGFPVYLWWDNESITDILDEAEKRGWVLRTSHTQIEWTEKGVQAVTETDRP